MTANDRTVLVILQWEICSFYWFEVGWDLLEKWEGHAPLGTNQDLTINWMTVLGLFALFALSNKSDQTPPKQTWCSRWGDTLSVKSSVQKHFFSTLDCCVFSHECKGYRETLNSSPTVQSEVQVCHARSSKCSLKSMNVLRELDMLPNCSSGHKWYYNEKDIVPIDHKYEKGVY